MEDSLPKWENVFSSGCAMLVFDGAAMLTNEVFLGGYPAANGHEMKAELDAKLKTMVGNERSLEVDLSPGQCGTMKIYDLKGGYFDTPRIDVKTLSTPW